MLDGTTLLLSKVRKKTTIKSGNNIGDFMDSFYMHDT
jgi:hypothetical protein